MFRYRKRNKEKDSRIRVSEFKGQGKHLLPGAKACAPVAIAAFARFSEMGDEEFYNTFLDSNKYTEDVQERKVNRILDEIVKTGIEINKKISMIGLKFFSKLIGNKETDKIWKKNFKDNPKDKNKFGVANIEMVMKKQSIGYYSATNQIYKKDRDVSDVDVSNTDKVNDFQDYEVDIPEGETKDTILKKVFRMNWIHHDHNNREHDLGFIVTTGGHTTIAFQRQINDQIYYISINSGDKSLERSMIDRKFRQIGQMEIHTSLDSLCNSLIQQWKDENTNLIGKANKDQTTPNQMDIVLFKSIQPRNKNQLVQVEDTNSEILEFFHLIQEIVFMPELKDLSFSLPTGIKQIRKELFEDNGNVDSIIKEIKAICNQRIQESKRRNTILSDFYHTIADEGKTFSLTDAITRLKDIKERLKEYSNQYQDVREYSPSKR